MRGCVWVVATIVVVCWGCASKKKLERVTENRQVRLDADYRAELRSVLNVLELLDVEFRQEETRDSSGNVRRVTDVHLSKRKESVEERQGTVEVAEAAEAVSQAVKETKLRKRNGAGWWWLAGVVMGGGVAVWLAVRYKRKPLLGSRGGRS